MISDFIKSIFSQSHNEGLMFNRVLFKLLMLILGSSYSAATKDMMAKMRTNGDTVVCLSRKHCGKRRYCWSQAISAFPTMFSKAVCC